MAAPHATAVPPPRTGPLQVLLVDDSPGIRELTRLMLAEHDEIAVREAGGGEQALELAAELVPDLVVMDQNMPGMDGLTTATHLRRLYPRLPIVAFTAMDGLESSFAGLGVTKVFGKTRIDELVAYVVEAARGSSPVPPPIPARRPSDPGWSSDRSRSEQLSMLIRSVEDYAIFLLDPEGYVRTWNSGAENIKGYTEEEAVGAHFSMFYTDEDRRRDHPAHELILAARTGRHEDEGWRLRKDGSRFWASVVITAVRDEEGVLVGFGKVTRDLTERKLAEEELRRANAGLEQTNEELDRFASVAAHDLQVPLRTISGFSRILERRHAAKLDDDGRRYLSHIAEAAEVMGSLVDNLLTYARAGQESGSQIEAIRLQQVVDEVFAQFAATVDDRSVLLVQDLEPDAVVLARPGDVDALLRNLVSNGVKYSDPVAPAIRVHARREGSFWRVEVIDNGPGIAPADRERVFRPFERLEAAGDEPGSGLGLSIAKRVAERNRGAIGVEAAPGPGPGSCFWFTVPVA